jgi:hypothetical protein
MLGVAAIDSILGLEFSGEIEGSPNMALIAHDSGSNNGRRKYPEPATLPVTFSIPSIVASGFTLTMRSGSV